jgi:hypothetical protein
MKPSKIQSEADDDSRTTPELAWSNYRTSLVEYLLNRHLVRFQVAGENVENGSQHPWTHELRLTRKRLDDTGRKPPLRFRRTDFA